jgi:serine protease
MKATTLLVATVAAAVAAVLAPPTRAAADNAGAVASTPSAASLRTLSMPNDPLVNTIDPLTGQPFEWQFAWSGVDRALDRTQGDPAIAVGVIDTGIAPVPDLAGKIDGLWSAAPDGTVTPDSPTTGNDDTGHGTAVASLIAANVDDGFGMAGFGGATHVIGIHAGYMGTFHDKAVAAALLKLDALGVRIVNMSLGGSLPSEPILIDAIHKAAADGILIVASSGNEHGAVGWPAAALQPSRGGRSFGLAVGATDAEGRLAEFSNAGKHLSLVAAGALGKTCPTGMVVALPPASPFNDLSCSVRWDGAAGARYGYIAGTSFAAPAVAGVAALVWAARPQLTNYQVADILKQSARRSAASGWTPTMGCGVLDAGAALELATSRTAAEWAVHGTTAGGSCSVDGAPPATWPSEVNQHIAFAPLRNRMIDERNFRVSARASSGLRVSFTAAGVCSLRRTTVHLSGLGLCSVTASQPGDERFHPARNVTHVFTVMKARPVV